MFTIQEALQLQALGRRAQEHEERIDLQLKATVGYVDLWSSKGIRVGLPDGDRVLAEYLRDRYRAGGWVAEITEFDPDRQHSQEIEYTLVIRAPVEPERGGPHDR